MSRARQKERAVALRKKGISIVIIERKLNIPRSTLSGWFKGIELTESQKEKLNLRKQEALKTARSAASAWHRAGREARIALAKQEANAVINTIGKEDCAILEIALAMLYLGEGNKTERGLSLGNSNPAILSFFLSALERLYGLKREKVSAGLHLRADQNEQKMKKLWAEALRIDKNQIGYVIKDNRTKGKKTYSHYWGVCNVYCGNLAIQRKLMYLSELFIQSITRA